MQHALSVGLSLQKSLIGKLTSISNNIANSSTSGFRSESLRFEELMAGIGSRTTSFPAASKVSFARQPGPVTKTENALDVALIGDGWLSIETPGGRRFSRDGRLMVRSDGVVTNILNAPILDPGGARVTLDPGGPPVQIARDGMISQNGAQVGSIGLFRIPLDATMKRGEGSSFSSDQAAIPIVEFSQDGLVQGAIEGSNVNPIVEMSSLIQTQRLFEAVTTAIEATESSLQEAIRTLGPSGR